MMTLDQISNLLSITNPPDTPDYIAILKALKGHKAQALGNNDQGLMKNIWCLESIAEVQKRYLLTYEYLSNGKYYDGWRLLEQIKLNLGRLRPHFKKKWGNYFIQFIEEKTRTIRSLFPYRIFFSSELLAIEKKCNICGKSVSIRNHCGHRVGEIYDGEYCLREVTECEILGVAIVENPVNDYSVLFIVDSDSGEMKDHYNYSLIAFLMKRWPTPFHDWTLRWTKSLHPKERYGQIGQKDNCPCESGKKYKDCCQEREGIIRPHCDFKFSYPISPDLEEIEYH